MDTFQPSRVDTPAGVRTTQAAEGLPRWCWSTAELVRLMQLGAFQDNDRFELIGGEIVPMSPVGRRHTLVAETLARVWASRHLPAVFVGEEKQFNLDAVTYTRADVLVWPAPKLSYDVTGPEALLVVEVADTSLSHDLGIKRGLYAAHGVREYWVIDALSLVTHVHDRLNDGRYSRKRRYAPSQKLTPSPAPVLALRLTDLGL